ncbi:NBS-LRR type disease resistance protein [Rhynchospora pubera]|uniref:NBS-LRR type disease resistance protein n=1 Tax=Rhynchospora pubera TaxID=906938 RepID=A0AAV8FVC7_9POAL|nr:NBS-LRR type disease resistance protein [Rhynchospora pubera]
MGFLNGAVSSIVPLVTNTIFKHVAYPFTAGDNIRALELATRQLRALKEDVNTEITNAERENGAPTNQAKEWLLQAENTEKEAEEIQQKYQQLCRCIWNISPNFCAIYKVSRSAAKMQVEVKSVCEKKVTLEVITRMQPPLAQEMPVSSSKSANLEVALHFIKEDVHNNIIGIWGMGGIGKTHLLEQINNELSRDPRFKLENNLISIVICDMDDVEYVKFESTKESQIDCRLGRLETLEFQRMISIKEVIWKSLEPKDIFPRLQCLKFWFCFQLISISWAVNLPCIRQLSINNCGSMKQLILIDELKNSGVKVSQLSFPFLKKLFLQNNSELERISDHIITFPALEFLDVLDCDNLKELPFNPSNPPRKLKHIAGNEEWWNNIEMEDGENKSSLQPFYKKWH